jgi:hypothetical protein
VTTLTSRTFHHKTLAALPRVIALWNFVKDCHFSATESKWRCPPQEDKQRQRQNLTEGGDK